ncbi:PAS domain S-box protein [Natronoglomus mannanivorans]|uniref:histidine kinase n=1 Tax=Natronoglomus mannanivorans TaxID=2979990 RepID=A0AAP3E3V0_9EURY|nr:PAS domain S-box protein [Halobacteria archaeon AArc-xg1-1]
MTSPSRWDGNPTMQSPIRRQEFVADLGRRAFETDDLDDLIDYAITAVGDALDAESVAVLEAVPGDDGFLPRGGYGVDDRTDTREPRRTNDGDTDDGGGTVPTGSGVDRDSGPESDSGTDTTTTPHEIALATDEPIVVDNLGVDDRFHPPAFLSDGFNGSAVCISIGSSDGPWGVFAIYTTTMDAFSDADGTFVSAVANVLGSVVDRERANRRRDVEATLKDKIVETSPIGITIVDTDGEMRFANDRAEEIFGRSKERINELRFDDPEWDEIGPDGQPLSIEELPFPRILESGEPLFDQVSGVLRPDGQRVWISVNGAPLTDGRNEIDGVVFAIEDVTDRFERSRELEQYETVVETAHEGIYVLDEERRFELVNDSFADLTAFSRAELRGRHASAVFGEEFASIEAEQWSEGTEDAPPTFEETIDAGPDETRTVENRFIILDEDGGENRIGVVRDVTDQNRMEAALREKERRFRTLSEHLEEVIWLTDADPSEYIYANPAYEDVFGDDRESLYDDGLSWLELVHSADRDRVRDTYTALPETPFDEEFRVVRPDGEQRWIHARAIPVTDEEGTVQHIVGIDADVTARKERERKLEKYRTIIEAIDDGVYTVDDEDRFTVVNRAFAELTDYDRETLLGAHESLVVDDEVVDRMQAVADESTASKLETTIETADGDEIPTETAVTTHVSDSGTRRRIGVVRDVSERLAYQRKLEESEQRYRTLIESFPNGAITMFDEDLRYTFADGQVLEEIGLPADELEGTTIHDLYPDELVTELEPAFRAVFDGEPTETDVSFLDRFWNVHIVPVRDDDGDVFAGMLVAVDVTERNEYKRRLEESNERLEQFAYAASHDLQEPLRMVSSYLQLLERRYGDDLDEDATEFVEFAVDGAERMTEMIDGLLEYSRVDTQGESFEPVDLDDLLEDVLDDLQFRIEESDAQITAESLPTVRGDASQLRRVLQNLVTNAIAYSGDEPPRIAIEAERRGQQCVLSVRDEGIGIAPDDQDRIFDIFQRLHTRDEHEGTGMGLSLSRRIVERHGGRIWVESESGEGTTFSLTLSLA